tara:strand:- start:2348 stop:2716 length:369 start_codon:yes stop_codon:yes gene_type:complete
MKNKTPDIQRFNVNSEFCGLHLIKTRAELLGGIQDMEGALRLQENVPDPVRKKTTSLMQTLRNAIHALIDLEAERNISCQNATLEKCAHTLTQIELTESKKQIEKLTLEGEQLRKSLSKYMT